MSRDWLALRLEAPLMSFGAEAIDQLGPTREYPSASMLTGLIANALGWRWQERGRCSFCRTAWSLPAAACGQPPSSPTPRMPGCSGPIAAGQRMASRKGAPAAGAATTPRTAAARLPRGRGGAGCAQPLPAAGEPDLAAVEAALASPARPLFIGRKSCLPACPVLAGRVRAVSAHGAIARMARQCRAIWPEGDGPEGSAVLELTDRRDWQSGLHGGQRRLIEGELP